MLADHTLDTVAPVMVASAYVPLVTGEENVVVREKEAVTEGVPIHSGGSPALFLVIL